MEFTYIFLLPSKQLVVRHPLFSRDTERIHSLVFRTGLKCSR